MKLIIDIPDNVYEDIEHGKGEYINTLNWAVRNGTPYEETEKLGATCLAKREVATERPQTIGCFNCKYDTKMLCEEPCQFCNFLYSEWRQKE